MIVIQSEKFLKIWSWMTRMSVNGVSIMFLIVVDDKESKVLVNHEKIHAQQWWEIFIPTLIATLLWHPNSWWVYIIPPFLFLIIYISNYLLNRIKMKHMYAYKNILMEKEAYFHQSQLNYLDQRTRFKWVTFIGRKIFL